ncbi:MAG: toll/interleukin-1 receptor domain-containing protein [Lachnospiraceae bacterium]|nr:toll/interleukin-1 receptor domain-containing protein [Butyrivibrio sp.]MCM1344639.1 toll/interleukin-1 receptor domain-containing protein [Muribaculaceae bacterium]MCM1410635.1 toll/interleukin-1 receptor domain-containing protein [Lachnospiraceae bacterium]
MIFICFSSKDAQGPLGEVLRCVERFELPVLYDPERLSADGDHNLKACKAGIEKAAYAILLLTPDSVLSACVQEEIQQIDTRYQNKNIVIFPILYGMKADGLPPRWRFLTKMMYYEAIEESEIYGICNHITCHILLDELNKYPFREIQTFILHNQNVPLMSYPVKVLNAYSTVDDRNQKIKVSLLYALYAYIKSSYNINTIPLFYHIGICKLFDVARLQLPVDKREIIILERQALLLLNAVLYGHLC